MATIEASLDPRWKLPHRDDGAWDAPGRVALLEVVLDALSEGVIVSDADGRVVYSNDTAPRMLGATPPTRSVLAWFEAAGLAPLGGRPAGVEEGGFLGCVLRGAEAPETVWAMRAHGEREPRDVSVVGHPLRGVDGAVEGAIVVLRDVTARMRATESVERLSRAMEQTADMVVITDREGRIEFVNAAFTAMTGYSPSEAIGRTPSLLKSGAHDAAEFAALWATILRGNVFCGTLVNRRKDGSTYAAEQTITPMRDRSGVVTHFVAVSKDMTERHRLREHEVESALAAKVQKRLYPESRPPYRGLDVAGSVFPAQATCGDYYDVLIRPDGRLAVVVGDVSGHGMPAAIVMAETRAYVRSLATTGVPADEILARINGFLGEDLTDGGFVSLLIAEIDPATGRIEYANAGHVAGARFRRDGSLRDRLDPTGPALGVEASPSYRLSCAPPLEPGEVLLLLTDGAVEAPGATGEPLGEDAVLGEASRLTRLPPARLADELHAVIERLSNGRSARDDVTILAVRALDTVVAAGGGEGSPPP